MALELARHTVGLNVKNNHSAINLDNIAVSCHRSQVRLMIPFKVCELDRMLGSRQCG